MKKTLIFLTILILTASAFAVESKVEFASFTEWVQINGYTPSFPDDPGDIIEQWAAPNGSPMGIEWDADGDFIWHVSENAPNDCMYKIEVATPHNIIGSYPCPNPYGIPDGGSMNGACIGNGYFYYTDYQGDLSVVDDHIVQVDRNTLAAVNQWEVATDIDQILGITYKAPYFYVVCNSTGLIYEVDLQPGSVYSIISTIAAPGGSPLSGIHYLEGNDTFWLASFPGAVVYETDASFNILQTIPAPGGAFAMGITWPGEGENYWLTDFGNAQFYIIDGDIEVSAQQTIQVDPLAVSYWTGTCTSTAFTDDSEVRGYNTEDGWMMFDISAVPVGATILEIEFHGYVNYTYYPWWKINGVAIDPLTASAADLYAEIQTNEYNYFMESSTFPTGWKVDILGGTANADMQAATVLGWFCIGINSTDNSTTYYINFDGWNETNPPYLMVTYEGGGGPLGELAGVVSEFGTGTPIEGAEVTIVGTGLSTTSLADGSYSFVDILPGFYDITCEAPMYLGAEELGFDIVSGPNTLDFYLLWSEIAVDVTELESYILPDETEVQTFTITNAGPGELVYNITFDFPAEVRVTNRSRNNSTPSRVSINTSKQSIIRETNNSSEDRDPNASSYTHGIPPTDDPGDIIFDIDVEAISGDDQCLGTEYVAPYLWVTGGGGTGGTVENSIYKIDPIAGTLEATYLQNTTSSWGMRDLCYDSVAGLLYAGDDNGFYSIDPADGTVTTVFTGAIGTCIRALAYDGTHFWTKSFGDPIYEFDIGGNIINSYTDPLSTYGMAYDSFENCLWLFASPTTFFQYDLNGAPTGNSYAVVLPNGGIIGGAFYDEGGLVLGKTVLGCLGQGVPDAVYAMELRDAASWVMVTNNISGTVPGNGGTIVVDVTFDATELLIGDVLTADLLIHNNANYTATRGDDYVIPVTLNVGGTALEVPTNVSVDTDMGLLTWDAPSLRDLIGYNVYLDDMGTVLANVGADVFEYQYEDLVNGTDYIAGVSAVYDEGESDIVEYPFTYTGVSADNIVTITTALKGNYPNPFNPVTNIAFSTKEAGYTTLEVYNMKGQLVKTLVNEVKESGNYTVTWNGTNNSNRSVSSGVYFYKMVSEGNSGRYTSTKKMILLK